MSNRNSKIIIAQNIKLDKNHSNVLNYTTNQMLELLNSNGIYVAERNDYSFIRRTGTIAADFPYSAAVTCNYMAFQNPDFSNKWFFAWIDNIEYKSDNSIEIAYTIDNWATWYDDFNFAPCLIDREHASSDAIGENIIPEPFAINDYVYQNFDEAYSNLDDLAIVLAYARNNTIFQHINEMNIYDNTIQGCDLYAFEINQGGAQALAKVIDDNVSTLGNILDIYAVPKFCLPSNTVYMSGYVSLSDAYLIPSQSVGNSADVRIAAPRPGTIWYDVKGDDFIPQNNKMYTAPFYMSEISNAMGQKASYAFEDFNKVTISDVPYIEFKLIGTLTNPVQLSLFPKYFKRYGGSQTIPENNETPLTIANYPKVAFSGDAFTAWMAQNSVPIILNTMENIAAKTMAGGTAGALMGIAESASSFASSAFQVANSSDATRGAINNGHVVHSQNMPPFNKCVKHISNQYAAMVDAHFSMFGYAQNVVKVPDLTNRQYWNFCKTNGLPIYGAMPETVIEDVNGIMNRGVTVWHGHDYMLNYFIGGTSMQNPII